MEAQITYPLSVSLQGLAGVKAIRASSEFGFSMINIVFEDSTEFYFARNRVLEKLSTADALLPVGVKPYMAPDATALGQIFWYTVEGGAQDVGRLRAIQDWFVRYQLQSVPGVAEVASVGGFPIEYQIDVDPNRLRAYGVTLGELYSAVAKSNSAVGGRVLQKGGSEYLIRSVGWIQSLADVERIVVKSVGGTPIYVSQVASVQFGSAARRTSLEKNGNEAVGGVVLMRVGENPLEITRRIKDKIGQLQSGLPEGVRIVPFYDRTRLIEAAIGTVSHTVLEEMLVASLAVILVMWHFRSALIICVTLPLAVLFAFILMHWLNIPSNIMSLSGIAISIGVLVDASIVMVDQGVHTLYQQFGNSRIHGDTRDLLQPALQTVGRPIFFAMLIMVLGFVPVFALSGMEGRMFHPLAYTKTFALIGVSILAITLVPALIPVMIRGRVRHEEDNWLVRRVIEIYRPALNYLMDRPWPIVWTTAVILLLGFAAGVSNAWVWRLIVAAVLVSGLWGARSWWGRTLMVGSLAVVALVAHQRMTPLGSEFMPSLDEGTILDMPITIPRASVTEAADDLKARDAVLRQFPEVESVVGKAGRAETATDPSPPEMIETVVNLRPHEFWPKRELHYDDALDQTSHVQAALEAAGLVKPQTDAVARQNLINDITMHVINDFERSMRQLALKRIQQFESEEGDVLTHFATREVVQMLQSNGRLQKPVSPEQIETIANDLPPQFSPLLAAGSDVVLATKLSQAVADQLEKLGAVERNANLFQLEPSLVGSIVADLHDLLGQTPETFYSGVLQGIESRRHNDWLARMKTLNWELADQAATLYTHEIISHLREVAVDNESAGGSDQLAALEKQLRDDFAARLFLWQKTSKGLNDELNTTVDMPGWGNIWTQPIINRVNMLATGVRTQVGIKVFGKDLNDIQQVSQQISKVVKNIPGAADVTPEQIVGEGYLEINIDREKAARYGVSVGDIQDVIETALGGRIITTTVEGRERFPVRIRYARAFREDEESVKNLLISAGSGAIAGDASGMPGGTGETSGTASASTKSTMSNGMAATNASSSASSLRPGGSGSQDSPAQIPLSMVADVKIVEGPSMIKSENGLLRSYVQLNVRNRDLIGFIDEARRTVAEQVKLPAGMYLEWSGEFEHQMHARRTLSIILPIVLLVIFVLLYITYHDLADTLLVLLLAVPGAAAGGMLFQFLFGFPFTVAVWVGYIACFGLATQSGLVMLVYLREAIDRRGGLENIHSVAELRAAIMDGAVHRTRPKLLTETTTIVGLAPMLWASGVGAEIMRPMAAPVLGGLLVSDEIIDLLLPVVFYRIRLWRWRKIQGRETISEHLSTATLALSN